MKKIFYTFVANNKRKMIAGRINKLFGTEGSLMVSLYDIFPEDFDPETTPLFVKIDALDVPLWCEKFERHGRSSAKVAFADFDTERRAEELLGREFSIADENEEVEEDDDEFYLEDLIGFTIHGSEIQADGAMLHFTANLTDYIDSESNPLFEIEYAERRVLVPAQEEFIAGIDFEEGVIKMVLPEGLLNLD